MKPYSVLIIMLILLSTTVYGYDKIIQYDENEDIILTTSVYNTSSQPCLACTCNLSVYNPYPNENLINISILLTNNGNGVYSVNVSNYTTLTYNEFVYPIILLCNDSSGTYGGDTREGIKVNPTNFDYTAGILALLGVGALLLLMSFKMGEEHSDIKKLTYFSSLAFFFLTLGMGYFVLLQSPNSGPFVTIMGTAITALLMIILAVMFLYFKERLIKPVEHIGNDNV